LDGAGHSNSPSYLKRAPANSNSPHRTKTEPEPEKKRNGGEGGFGDQDALIVGLFRKLLEPGTEWTEEDRQKWLQTAANIFDLVTRASAVDS
jgi:hypothetical protein